MEEWPPIWTVAANILNKQSRTADKGQALQLGGWARGQQLLNRENVTLLLNIHQQIYSTLCHKYNFDQLFSFLLHELHLILDRVLG
jgi:hypothetical protein